MDNYYHSIPIPGTLGSVPEPHVDHTHRRAAGARPRRALVPRGPRGALQQRYAPGDAGVAREVGAALAETESIVLMNLRGVIRAVEASEPGAEANVTKLLGSELVQRKAALMTRLAGPAAAVREGDERRVSTWLMATLGATIGGGTSEILRNQIGERLLGLPRDPLIS